MNHSTLERQCTIDGCGEKHAANGYCRSHNYRYKRYGNPLEVRQIQAKDTDGTCKVDGCKGIHNAKGYCVVHYRSWARYGDPLYEHPTTCKIDGCEGKLCGWGLCQKHYIRWRTHGDPLITLKLINTPCIIEGCENKNRRNGYCEECYKKSELFRNRHRMYSAKRRSLQLDSPISDFKSEEWEAIQSNFKHSCAYCGKQGDVEQEHVVPLSRRGSHTVTNIITACRSCNSSKRQSSLESWYHKQPFYDRGREKKILEWMGYKIHEDKIQMQLF